MTLAGLSFGCCARVDLQAQTGDLVWSSTFPAGSQLFQTRHRVTVNHPPEIAIVYQSAAGMCVLLPAVLLVPPPMLPHTHCMDWDGNGTGVYTVDFVLAETGAPVSTETTTVTNTRLVSRLPVLDAFHRHVLMLVDEANMVPAAGSPMQLPCTTTPSRVHARWRHLEQCVSPPDHASAQHGADARQVCQVCQELCLQHCRCVRVALPAPVCQHILTAGCACFVTDATNGVITGYAAGELVGDQFSSVEAWKVVIPASTLVVCGGGDAGCLCVITFTSHRTGANETIVGVAESDPGTNVGCCKI